MGITDAAGAFQLSRRAGEATLIVAPAVGSGLPTAIVKKVPAEVSPSGWTLTYGSVGAAVDLDGKVLRADKVTPAAGARVELSLDSTAMVGALTAGGKSYPATWQYRRTLVSDSTGALVDPKGGELKVPPGVYRAEVWPGSGEPPEEGFATASGLDPSKLVLTLRRRVELTGGVAKPDPRTKIQVTAVSRVGTFTTTIGSDGRFTMLVDDQMSYTLTARALGAATRRLGAYVAPSIDVNGRKEIKVLDLPEAVIHRGVLKQKNNNAVAGALIRVYCNDPACPDRPLVEEARSQEGGYFELRIPLPGTRPQP
jgi:hypothetical protein